MKKSILLFAFLTFTILAYTQTLPIDFETEITTSDFVNFEKVVEKFL